MAKFLRCLAVHCWEPAFTGVFGYHTIHLCWMYEHYALPYESGGIVKINVEFTAATDADLSPPEVVGTADVKAYFDAQHYGALSSSEQQRYFLDRMHAAVIRCAVQFGWDPRHFEAARDRMLADDLRFTFFWKKPLASPDRSLKVQGWIEAGPRTNIWLIFSDRSGKELRRSLLTVTTTGSMDLRFIFGEIAWVDSRTVRITQKNGRDYWICTTDGGVEFHYPRAEQGNPQGEFALGRMYYEGTIALEDRQRGLHLIRSAAEKGDKHAKAFLRHHGLSADPGTLDARQANEI